MRQEEKKKAITDFLQHLGNKDIHLVEIGKFDKSLSLWSKSKPQTSHRTMINVNVKLERLNEGDVNIEIEKFLMG